MGNVQGYYIAPMTHSPWPWDDEEGIFRVILNSYQDHGNAIISFVNRVTDSAPVDTHQFSALERQLKENADNVIRFLEESYDSYTRCCEGSSRKQAEVDWYLLDQSTPVPCFLTDYLQTLWRLLQVNNVVLISVERNNIIGRRKNTFLNRNYAAKLLIKKIKRELVLRRSVQNRIIEYVECHVSEGQRCCDRWTPRGLDFAKLRHKLTYASQYPTLMFLSIKNQKNSSNKDRIHDALKAITKEVPYFPLMVTNALQDVDMFVTISEEDEDVRVMMSVFTDKTFTSLCDYESSDSLTIEKFLVKLLMRDYHKYRRKTIEYPRKRIVLCPKEAPPHYRDYVAYEDEYNSSKTNENSLTFQNSIDVLPIRWHTIETLTPEKLREFKVIDATNGLKEFVEEKFGKEWMWLNEEAKNPDGSLFDVDATTADIFFRFLFNIKQLDKIRFLVGVPLYLLQRFIRSSEHVREWLSQSTKDREKACTLFCNSVNSLMPFGSLLAYYHVLNDSTGIHDSDNAHQRFTEQQMDMMKERLKDRKVAEMVFVDYFLQSCQVVSYRSAPQTLTSIAASHFPGLLNSMNKFPYVFFLVFVKRYQFVTHEENRETNQLHVLGLLCDALHSSPDDSDNARRIFRSETRDYDGWTFRELYEFFHYKWEEVYLQRFMEKLKVKTYRWGVDITPLNGDSFEGGQGEATLVYASDIAVALIAKRFFDNTRYREVSGEIECLLGNQFNPHIVQIYGCILDGNSRFSGILMEFCEGGTLHDYIERTSSYATKDIIHWTSHASCGLLYLHENNIVHKDVKPKNMLLDATHKRLKICDLGISKMTSASRENNGQRVFVTVSDSGTPGYRAPEVTAGEANLTAAVDVFSLGRSVWHMMHRTVPGRDLLPMPVAIAISNDAWLLVYRMMQKEVRRRPRMSNVFCNFKEWDRAQPLER